MGHGNHWEAIASDTENTIATLMPAIIQEGTIVGQAPFDQPLETGGTRPEKVFALTYPATPLRYLALVVTDSSRPEPANFVASAYPFCAEGLPNRIVVDEVKLWEGPIEGLIRGSARGGAAVTFFDAGFYQHRYRYTPGQACDFAMAGLAYTLRKATQDTIIVTEGPMLEIERQSLRERDPNADVSQVTSVEISLAELRCLIQCDGAEEDAQFRTIAEEVGYFEAAGFGFYRIRAVLMQPDDIPFQAYLYASESVLGGYRPQKGDSIEGVLWLQGHLVSGQEFEPDPTSNSDTAKTTAGESPTPAATDLP